MDSTDSFDFSRLRAFGLETQTSCGEWLALVQYSQIKHIERAITEKLIIGFLVPSKRDCSKGSYMWNNVLGFAYISRYFSFRST